MGDTIPIDWSLAGQQAQAAGGMTQSAQQGALAGYELGQRKAVRGALNSFDPNHPETTGAALDGLIKAGATDQASALAGLQFQRGLRTQLPSFFDRMSSSLGGQPAAQAPAQPSAPQPDPQHVVQTMGMATDAAKTLLATPLADRPAAFNQIKQQLVARGVPEAAVDEAGDDLSDAGLQKHLAYYQASAAHVAGQLPGGQPTDASAVPPHPTGYAWAKNLLNDPGLMAQMEAMKGVGLDMTGLITQAQALQKPDIEQGALDAHQPAREGQIAQAQQTALDQHVPGREAATAQAKLPFTPPVEGAQPLYSPGNPNPVAWHMPDGAVQAINQVSEAKSAGEAAGKAPYEIHQITGPDGQPIYVTAAGAAARANAHSGLIGAGQSPAEKDFATAQAGQAAELLKPDITARNTALDTQTNADRALSFLQSNRLDKATPIRKEVADTFRALGVDSKFANDAAAYQSVTNQELTMGAKSVFPQRVTNADLQLYKTVVPQLTTPNDAASVYFGIRHAQAARTQAYEDFKANYQGPHTPGAVAQAWAAGPGGQSVFQDPVWRNIKIAGQPAVTIKNVNGKDVGAFAIGTGHPVYFVAH